ncbi:uncharacterized protein MONBRDRAFT_25091 [Monosiga brevicollis MX1]|uniref:PIPK domain-containing protein n=1 Tax=Monosiga brevicollis TaxID=81824 RepID=A9UYD9_MONBE|nr:uncharacterized protein MONBRDRAFT_25091 [Monosiga brevicollis MX1]EDQ89588.1 predicted protein [Monosiga brevicollis MX1]|eukprot:XP_001745617.1 hypothetical protein [Monosiga brevicollis MX1]
MDGPTSKLKKVKAWKSKGKAFRQADPLLAVLQWGVDHTMTQLEYVPVKELILVEDFKAHSKIAVANHLYNDHELPSKFKVKEYCPLVFRDLRRRFQEDMDDYLYSLCEGPLAPRSSSARTGSHFYVSHDQRLVLKSLSKEEVLQFHHTFQAYHSHIVELGCRTLLPRYLGMYRITVHDRDSYVVIMNSVLSAQTDAPPQLYDLKGSTFERHATEKDLEQDVPVLKDGDFLQRSMRLELGTHRADFCDRLAHDVRMLEHLNLMDYSLLLAVYRRADIEDVDAFVQDAYALPLASPDQEYLYCAGIIDVLTVYNRKKKAAHAAKTAKHGKAAEFTTVNPEQYAHRFLEFLTAAAK